MKNSRILIICIVILIACWVFAQPPIQPILNFFLDLEDTPSDYTGQDGKIVKVDETNNQLIFETESGAVEDDAYGAGWNGDTANAPSQNATYDILHQYDTDDDGDIDNIDGAVGGGDITGVGPGGLAAGDALTDGYVTTGTKLFIWEGTSDDGNEFSIIVPEDPGSDIDITMPTATATLNAAGDITGTDAGTDLTADLEEEVTEGSLADSTIISADIKNGEIALVDLAAAAYAKDIVTTSPITGGTDNVLVGADGDITIAIGDADDDGSTKGAASFDNTDFDAVGGNVTINDDGHAHTGTSISGLDVSDDTNLAVGTGLTLTDDTLTVTEEDIEDFVGGMLGGTETHIAVTYQDGTNDIDFVVDPAGVAGAIAEGELADSIVVSADIKDDTIDSADYNAGSIDYEHLAEDVISGAAAVGTFESGDTFLVLEAGVGLREADYDDLPSSALTEEQVEDFVGGMLGGTETHIAVTYQDASNDIDFVVDPASVAGAIGAGELADDIVNDDDINWVDLTYLTTNGAAVNEAYASGWNADVGPAEKDDIYDYLHAIDSDDDGSLVDESWYTTQSNTIDFSGATLTMPKRTKNNDRFYAFNLFNPNSLYDTDTQICFEPNLPANITITEVTITCDADPATELDIDLKWADAFIGLGNATLIEPIDTTNGTTDIDSGFDDATVVAGKCMYIEFAADPDSNIKQAIVKIRYDFD